MISVVDHTSKEKIDTYLVTIVTTNNCDHILILYPVYKLTPEFSLCFIGLKS